MKKIIFVLSLFFLTVCVFAADDAKQLYKLPEKNVISSEPDNENDPFIVGGDSGLFRITNRNTAFPLWKEGKVEQLLKVNIPEGNSIYTSGWLMRTSKGIVYTKDFKVFEERNNGLSFLTIKKYKDGIKSLEQQIQELKDLSVNPLNNKQVVTATKDNVYYSDDGGLHWRNLGSMSQTTSGIKAVAVVTLEEKTVVIMAHPIFGLSYCYPDEGTIVWNDITAGFDMLPSLTSPDEIADILPVVRIDSEGNKNIEIYISQTYIPRIYKLDWENKRGVKIYSGKEPVDCIDGLTTIDNVLMYTHLEGFGAIDLDSYESPGVPKESPAWDNAFASVPGAVNTAWIPQNRSGFGRGIILNELWLLYPGTINSPYAEKANGRKSIYASCYQCSFADGVEKFKRIVKERNMNSIVIDMKDDNGYLRYDTHDPLVKEKCSTSSYAIKDLNSFIETFKKENIYLVARIVTFKDKSLTKYDDGKYAIWDSKLNKPWVGTKGTESVLDKKGNPTGAKKTVYYDENWVDPYSEEVWEYNVAIAKELIERGFDEIQFDYIRFPTDGYNLYNAKYRWQDKGMDKESALISFLSYARENINAPIGIDIYGANGWYRSGTRTGQDVEALSKYVDVIGPMFYPSHFEQTFLNYSPVADRTYRVYYYGSFRNTIMCRNRTIIRPWIQSFYLNVSYDRLYYNSDYVLKELFGARDSLDRGYMCWNNSGEYGTTPADVNPEDKFIGTTFEAGDEFRKPAIGTRIKPLYVDSDVSVLDSILNPNREEDPGLFKPFLKVRP